MKQAILVATLIAATMSGAGCSWAFQKTLQGGLEGYDGKSEPRCSPSQGLPTADTLIALAHVIGVALTLGQGRDMETPEEVYYGTVAGDIAGVILHGASAATGFARASDCAKAHQRWKEPHLMPNKVLEEPSPIRATSENLSNDPRLASSYWCSEGNGVCSADRSACSGTCQELDDVWCARYVEHKIGRYGYLCGVSQDGCTALTRAPAQRRGRDNFGECVKQRAQGPKATKPPPPTPPVKPAPPPPRGFFCASSPAAGLCAREKADCQQARDAAVAATPDLSECALVETAWCDGDRCTPAKDVCERGGATCAEQR